MNVLDIRKNEDKITHVAFDDSADYLEISNNALFIKPNNEDRVFLCYWKDVDNFVLACKKAKEIAKAKDKQ